MRISDVECHVLVDPDRDVSATSSAQDTIVVAITTEDGVTGYGETDLNPFIARAHIEAPSAHSMALSLKDMLIGADPMNIEALWDRLYVGSAMTGRRGEGINAIGAIDLALHDLRGKLLGTPAWELLDQPLVRTEITPYASLQPDVSDVALYGDALIADTLAVKDLGFRAAKAALTLSGPYAHKGMQAPWSQVTDMLGALREAVGDDFTLMVDVQYAFGDLDTCLHVLREWERFNLFFVETPLWTDDLADYRRLSQEQSIPIAAGEWLTTRHEFRHLVDEGGISVAQPDIGRVGGLSEALKVAALAEDRGRIVIPHLWKTGLSIAAALHFAAVTKTCQFVEFLPAERSDSAIRRELTPDFPLVNGQLQLPMAPGLGVDVDWEALTRFELAAKEMGL